MKSSNTMDNHDEGGVSATTTGLLLTKNDEIPFLLASSSSKTSNQNPASSYLIVQDDSSSSAGSSSTAESPISAASMSPEEDANFHLFGLEEKAPEDSLTTAVTLSDIHSITSSQRPDEVVWDLPHHHPDDDYFDLAEFCRFGKGFLQVWNKLLRKQNRVSMMDDDIQQEWS